MRDQMTNKLDNRYFMITVFPGNAKKCPKRWTNQA